MATFSLVHGAWHGGWAWDRVRSELEARGHGVAAPDLPCDDVSLGVADYARCVPPADVAVGHSLGGLTLARVDARVHVYLCALVPGVDDVNRYVPGFGDSRAVDELGRSHYPDPADAARELQYPEDAVDLAKRLRPQTPIPSQPELPSGRSVYVVCMRDAAIEPEWQRRAAAAIGADVVELDAGHSPMLTHARELADVLERYAAS